MFKSSRIILLCIVLISSVTGQHLSLGMFKYHSYHDASVAEYTADYDFSTLFKGDHSYYYLGIIGENYRRIRVKFISVIQDRDNPANYYVYGKTNVNGNVCDFQGEMTIETVKLVDKFHLGVDQMYEDSSIVEQGVILANYKFFENQDQKHVGIFEGEVISGWYRKDNKDILYDDIEWESDSWCNNQFIGSWTQYGSRKEKICNWGHARIPGTRRTLDVGIAEFYPSEKYYAEGWEQPAKAWAFPDYSKEARKAEAQEWWK